MTIEELAVSAGTTVRNVRFYIAEGLLPRPDGAGRGANYTEEHLSRLRAILRLRQRNLPLSEIRRNVVGVAAEDLDATEGTALDYIDRLLGSRAPQAELAVDARMAKPSPSPMPAASPAPPAELADERGPGRGEQWRRVRIHPDVELNIREPIPPGLAYRLPKLIETLRRALEGKD